MEAIVLAGGLGTRLRSVISDIPKCMAPVGDRPFLSILLNKLARQDDIDRVILSVGYLKESVIEWVVKNRSKYPFEINFAVEDNPLGTGGGIRLALEKCRQEEIVILNGDTYFDLDLDALKSSFAALTIALKPLTDFDRYGAVEMDDNGVIRSFSEKQFRKKGLINGGVYLIRRSSLDLSSYPEKFSFEKDVLEPLSSTGNVHGIVQDGYFIDIGIPDDYTVAQLKWGPWTTLLLDRDGVINTLRPDDYVKNWSEFEFRPSFLELIPELSEKFKHIFVVTNQRGVGKGLMSQCELEEIHRRMISTINGVGGRIDKIYCCTATDGSDPRRKPNIGMWDEIMRDFPEMKSEDCVMLGDSETDMEFASNCGIKGLRINW